jgi:MtrB/PioB family decaheme-associated outer membrane protein
MPTKAPAVEPLGWWYEGFAEVGGRFNLNNPDRKTLGKFYEYRDLRPGVFGNFFFGAHRVNDPFDIEVWGKNVGWDDQAFGLDIAKPGAYYLTLGWDETPHVFTKNAKTLYNGVGTNNLTLPVFLSAPPGADDAATIAANSKTIDLKVRRDTASAAARWTPSDNWDFNADYSHTHREGTMALGAVSFSGPTVTRSTFELPRPVDETTQNGSLKGEYAGSTPWGKPFNVALAGGVSVYDNSDTSLSFQNPWNPVDTATRPLNNLYSLAPSNQAQNISVSGGVGLPFNSRYMGTFQYSNLQSDDANLPWTNNTAYGATPSFLTPSRDASTTLFNNVLHTQITSDLKSTLRYRYYNYDTKDDSPAVVFAPWYSNPDSKSATNKIADDEERFPRNFTKQNADAQLAWQTFKWLTVGAGYGWERWDRGIYRDAPVTNESTGKVFADAKWGWSTLRTSLQFGERRYDDYQTPPVAGGVTDAFRMRDLANRDRTKGQFLWAIDVTRMVTVSPNGGFLLDDYQTNFNFFDPTEAGIKKAHSWNAGADVTFNMSRNVALFASYNYEEGDRQVYTQGNPTDKLSIETTDRTHTFIFGSKVTVIPEKLYVDANYTYTRSTSEWNLNCTPAGCQYGPPLATFPDSHNTMNRLDVQAKYVLDDSFMRNAGFAGKAYVKARVLWERNSNDAWQPLQDQLGWLVNASDNTTRYSIWMGTGNPNYDVVLAQLSFGVKW